MEVSLHFVLFMAKASEANEKSNDQFDEDNNRISIPTPTPKALLLAVKNYQNHVPANECNEAFLVDSSDDDSGRKSPRKRVDHSATDKRSESGVMLLENKIDALSMKKLHTSSELPRNNWSLELIERIIVNFYSLYFSHKKMFCKILQKEDKLQTSSCANSRSSNGQPKTPPEPKKTSFWTKIKSFFGSKVKPSTTKTAKRRLKAFIQESRVNQSSDENSDVIFEYPGLKESQIESFFLFYYLEKQHECRHCHREKRLIVRMFQKDILAKIGFALDLTRQSVKIVCAQVLGPDRVDKIFAQHKSHVLYEDSTKSHTKAIDASSEQIGRLRRVKRRKKEKKADFCEYDFVFNINRSTSRLGKKQGEGLHEFRSQIHPSPSSQREFDNMLKIPKRDSMSKLERMSQRSTSKLSNYFKSESKPKPGENARILREKGSFSERKVPNPIPSPMNVGQFRPNASGKSKAIIVPPSTLNLDWSSPKFTFFKKSPKEDGMARESRASQSKLRGFTSLKHIGLPTGREADERQLNLARMSSQKTILNDLNRLPSQGSNWPWGNSLRKKKTSEDFLNMLQKKLPKQIQSKIQSSRAGKNQIFRLEALDNLGKGEIKQIDFSQMNSQPRGYVQHKPVKTLSSVSEPDDPLA